MARTPRHYHAHVFTCYLKWEWKRRKAIMILWDKTTLNRLPSNILHTLANSTPLHSIPGVWRPRRGRRRTYHNWWKAEKGFFIYVEKHLHIKWLTFDWFCAGIVNESQVLTEQHNWYFWAFIFAQYRTNYAQRWRCWLMARLPINDSWVASEVDNSKIKYSSKGHCSLTPPLISLTQLLRANVISLNSCRILNIMD